MHQRWCHPTGSRCPGWEPRRTCVQVRKPPWLSSAAQVTTSKEGAIVGGDAFLKAMGDDLLDSFVGDQVGS